MNLINKLLKISGIIIVTFSAMIEFAQAKDVSISEFVKLDFEQRVAICAQIVPSNEIGDCASISPPQGEPVSTARLMEMGADCFSGEITDSKKIGQCVRDKFDARGVSAGFPTKEHIIKAYNICSRQVASNEIGACTAALCTRLE